MYLFIGSSGSDHALGACPLLLLLGFRGKACFEKHNLLQPKHDLPSSILAGFAFQGSAISPSSKYVYNSVLDIVRKSGVNPAAN